ncbi:MAG: (2Fe-2S)-binding protein [Methylomonas sp.]|nr:(2Fe-2S)-binding protein [Methylomonas sp.]PPD19327.1 MAG: (2Fe-2S)-binding protein [Methylomonas sp.]PPD24783.1 MAG: (2Fe-2S)-binding protein [Methylomonas sp.]PPD33482.1 MAG: (2Fe-2S)-binding protein [Methylomonas sp.]PPD54886.1 MAG: (2Fe-2S)-binding protein [Methylomonas sp.]
MYVCVCKAITDKQLLQAIDEGACTRRKVMQCTGAGGVCGKCTQSIKALVEQKFDTPPVASAA